MKHVFILILLVLMAPILLCGQSKAVKAPSTMKFDHDVWNYGTIKEVDGVVKHVFEFTNIGKKPFVIENVSVSCGCTTPIFSREPVMPGKKGRVEIEFDPSNRPGVFTKEIYVTSNNRANQNLIRINGDVVGRPRTVEDDFPFDVGMGLRLSTMSVEFGYIAQRVVRSMTVSYVNTSKRSITLSTECEPKRDYFSVAAPASICAGCRGEITLTYDLRKATVWGMESEKIFLVRNGLRATLPISITSIGVDDFSGVDLGEAPRVKLSTQFLHMGDVKGESKQAVVQEVTISNEGRKPLVVRDISVRDGMVCTLVSGTAIAPGKSMSFEVRLLPSAFDPGRVFASVFIVLNDPAWPMRELRVVANVK